MDFTLRPASPDDFPFLWWLHCHSIRPWVEALWGWDEHWQAQYFSDKIDTEKLEIIEIEAEPIGCLWVERHHDHIHLDLVEIAPEFQGRGLGTKLIEGLIVESDGRGVPIRLRVLTTNPAKALYERLGFRVVKQTAERYWMERPAAVDANKEVD
jgi:ribosomal protein S18 acetylase RimI-like enzyme